MRCRTVLPWALSLLAIGNPVHAQHGHGGFGHGGGYGGSGYGGFSHSHGASWMGHGVPVRPIHSVRPVFSPVSFGAHPAKGFAVAPTVLFGWGPSWGIVPYVPPIVVVAPGSFFPAGPPLPPQIVARGLDGLPPIRRDFTRAGQPAARQPGAARRGDAARSTQLVTLGDRLFRGGNLHRAAERFEQALQANPNAAAPRVRLAQVALMRGNYAEAANRFREAQAAEPGWLLNAPDIQAIYAEPADFAAPIAKLETHLQANPNDRDAWLVLGAQWYLSGRTRQAADVFRRLTDRPADSTLTAFLDATTPVLLPPAAQ